MDDLRLRMLKIRSKATDVERTPQPGVEAENFNRCAGLPNLLADRTGFMDATDHRREARRQPAHEIQDHFFGATHPERVSQIDDAYAGGTLNAQLLILTVDES